MSTRRAFSDAAQKIGTTAKCYYASKALLTTEVVRWVDQAGLSIDVSTSGELAVAWPPELKDRESDFTGTISHSSKSAEPFRLESGLLSLTQN